MGQLQEYYESRTERSIELRLSVLTVLGIPTGLIVGLYSSKLVEKPVDIQTWTAFLAITAATTIAVAIPYWLWPRLYARWRAWRDGAEG